MKCIADIMAPWVFLDGDEPTHHDYHWHRYHRDHEDWMSIWVDYESWGEWTVEIYPDPDSPGRSEEIRTSHNTIEEAAQRVADLMEKHS